MPMTHLAQPGACNFERRLASQNAVFRIRERAAPGLHDEDVVLEQFLDDVIVRRILGRAWIVAADDAGDPA